MMNLLLKREYMLKYFFIFNNFDINLDIKTI